MLKEKLHCESITIDAMVEIGLSDEFLYWKASDAYLLYDDTPGDTHFPLRPFVRFPHNVFVQPLS